jgi:hypothetical protein
MKKKVLYITNSTNECCTLGYRHSNIIKHCDSLLNIDLLNFEFTKSKFTFFKRILNKLFIYPDFYYFNLLRYKRQIQYKLIQNQYDLAFVGVVPFSFLSLVSFIKKKQPNLKVIVDMTDPLTANNSYIHDTFFHNKFISWYEKKHFKNIDILIVLNEEIKNYYHLKYDSIKSIIVLEQGINLSSFENHVKNINNKLEVIYAGMLYKNIREPFELYDAINNYSGSIRLSVFGGFKKMFLPPINERFYYGGLVDKNVTNKKTLEADIIVFLDNFYGIQIPGKILECLATNKPLLFIYENEQSPTLKYVNNYEGIFYSKNDSKEIIRQLNIMSKYINVIFKRDITKYDWEILIKESFLVTLV